MTDLQHAIEHLDGHSICLCKDNTVITDDGKGISPIMKWIAEGRNLSGYSAADLIVGKAAAMLFVKAGIVAVYGKTMSGSARDFLKVHSIPCQYDTLAENIINRSGTDICPMEQTVLNIEEPDIAYASLLDTIKNLKNTEKN